MTQYGFFFDQSRCTTCHACEVACREVRHLPVDGGVKWMRVYEWEKGDFPYVRVLRAAIACLHCEQAKCIPLCPKGAIAKDPVYGAVLVDAGRCDGDCERQCAQACPYGAPQFVDDERGTPMQKCDMCIERVAVGDQPVCVMSCPMRALDFGLLSDLERRYGGCRDLEDLPPAQACDPAWVVKPAPVKVPLIPYPLDEAIRLLGVAHPGSSEGLNLKRRPRLQARTVTERLDATRDHYT